MKTTAAFAFLILMAASGVEASPFTVLDTSFGQDTGTFDPTSGLIWLDVSVTAGRSVNDIVLDPIFSEWRYASSLEVVTLINDAGLPFTDDTTTSITESNAAFSYTRDRVLAFGDTVGYSWEKLMFGGELGFQWLISGYTGDVMLSHGDPSYRQVVYFDVRDHWPPQQDILFFGANVGYKIDVARQGTGHWLVQQAPVPVPESSTMALVAIGVGLMLIRKVARRQKSRAFSVSL